MRDRRLRIIIALIIISVIVASVAAVVFLKPPPTRKNMILEFLAHSKRGDGYADSPNAKNAHLTSTYYSYMILKTLDTWNDTYRDEFKGWLKDVYFITNTDDPNYGLFADSKGVEPTIYTIYYGVKLCIDLGLYDELVNVNNVCKWIFDCYHGGCFSYRPNESGSIIATFYAVSTLDLLGELNESIKTEVKNWVINFMNSTLTIEAPQMDIIYAGVMTLRALNVSDQWYQSLNLSFYIRSLYERGKGFKLKDDVKSPDLLSTFWALDILIRYDKGFVDSIRSDVIGWVLSLQGSDGGFSLREKCPSSLEATYAAVKILEILNALSELEKIRSEGVTIGLPPYLWIFIASIIIVTVSIYLMTRRKGSESKG